MPYFDHMMATSISDGSSDSMKSKRKILRTVASCSKKTETISSKQPDTQFTSKYKCDLNLRKLIFMRNLLKAEIETLKRQKGALSTTNNPNYQKYSYQTDKVLGQGVDSILYEGNNVDYPDQSICCRLYNKNKIELDGIFLKILRHLGKKHQSIVQTWEIFTNKGANIEIFQEYCSAGNLQQFLQNNTLNEKQVSLYAWQLLKGLDFLGDIGISHRDIQPKNLLLKPAKVDNFLKINNFRKAIIYWSVPDNDVIYLPCLPAEEQSKHGENFQAPECYGDPNQEEFDPIVADTWSFGAVIYYMISKQYPYKVGEKSEDLEQEIKSNIDRLTLSPEGKDLLNALLMTDAAERMPIGFIEKSSWFTNAKKSKLKAPAEQDKNIKVAKKLNDFFRSNVFARPGEFSDGQSSSQSSSSVDKKSKASVSRNSKTKSGVVSTSESSGTLISEKAGKSMDVKGGSVANEKTAVSNAKSKAVSSALKSKTVSATESNSKSTSGVLMREKGSKSMDATTGLFANEKTAVSNAKSKAVSSALKSKTVSASEMNTESTSETLSEKSGSSKTLSETEKAMEFETDNEEETSESIKDSSGLETSSNKVEGSSISAKSNKSEDGMESINDDTESSKVPKSTKDGKSIANSVAKRQAKSTSTSMSKNSRSKK